MSDITQTIVAIVTLLVLAIVLQCLRWATTCKHQELGWPIGDKQRCLQCGAVRPYRMGEKPGEWQRENI
jgi:hypothetical protein